MCATNLWAVNAAAFTPEFQRFTTDRLGIAPARSEFTIASSRVRGSSVIFTLTARQCDCSALIGLGAEREDREEISAEAWLGWLHDLPEHVSHVSRLAVLRAWSPSGTAVTPEHARGLTVAEVDEQVLRTVGDDHLLTIDYPRTF